MAAQAAEKGRGRKIAGALALAFALLLLWRLVQVETPGPRGLLPAPHAAAPGAPAAGGPAEPAQVVVPTPALPPPQARGTAAPPPAVAAANPDGGPALFGQLNTIANALEVGRFLAENAKHADEWVDRLCDEARRLREKPAVAEPPKEPERDAAAFMAPLMDYESPLDTPPGRLHLQEELRARLAGYGADSFLRMTDVDLAGLDFAWMTALGQFDHWSLLGAGQLRDWTGDDWFTTPIPNYIYLQWWVKLRYALAFRRGDLLQASAEVRHLADLIHSQGLLVGDTIALATYGLDARARELAAAAGRDVSGWPVGDLSQLRLQRRMTFGSMYFAYPGVKPETVRKAAGCMPSPCTSLIEAEGANKVLRQFAASDNLALVAELARAQGCEQAALDRAAASRALPSGEALDALVGDFKREIPGFFVAQ